MRKFFYYILLKDGRSGKKVNGVITYTGDPSPLPQTPTGWQELLLEWTRSPERHGLISTTSLPLGFVRDGAHIVRDALYNETVEADRLLLIQQLKLIITPTKFRWVYQYFCRFELDLPKAEDGTDIVRVPISEGTLTRLLKANEKTNFDLSMNDPRCVWVKMDGIMKNFNKEFTVEENQEIYGTNNFYLGMFGGTSEGRSTNVAFFDVPFQPASAYPNDDNFVETVDVQVVRIKGYIDVYFNKTVPLLLRVETNVGPGFPQYELINIAGSPRPAGSQERMSFDVTFTMAATSKYNMKIFGGTPTDPTTQFTVTGGVINVQYESRGVTRYRKAWKRFDLYQELIAKVTGDPANAISQLCKDYNSLLITSAEALRGLEDATLKTNLNDFISDTDATLMAGLAVLPNGIELEGREKYYDESEVTDLGRVVEFEKKPAEDKMCNTIKTGHTEQSIENVNGRYDPNGTNEFIAPLTKTDPKEYDITSPYKAGPYEIDELVTNLVGQDTTDTNNDNDVYVIAAVGADSLNILAEFDQVLGGIIIDAADKDSFMAGQQLRISGTVLNDNVYDVTTVAVTPGGYLVSLAQGVFDEGPIGFLVEFLQGAVYTLDRPAYTTLEGVPNATIFNLPLLTPKTMLLRHKPWLASMYAGQTGKKIKFSSGKDNKNTELKTVLGTVTMDEDADESVQSLGAPLFLPWYFTFKTEVPVGLPELLELNPNRSFKFTDELDNEWIGFLEAAGIAPNEYTPQEFRLLAAPSNDITKLIHG